MPRTIMPSGLRLTQVATSRELVLPAHTHHRSVLALLQSGGLEQAGSADLLSAGGVRFAPAGAVHDLRLLPGTHLIVVECDRIGVAGSHPLWSRITSGLLLPHSQRAPALIWSGAAAADSRGLSFEVEDRVLRLLAAVHRRAAGLEPRPFPTLLTGVLHQILNHPAARVRLGDLARQAGIHRVQLGRLAREFLGRPLWHVAMSARLELSRGYLLGTSCSLAQIANLCGFCDQSHLNRAFRRRFGAAPGHFRQLFHASKTVSVPGAMLPG